MLVTLLIGATVRLYWEPTLSHSLSVTLPAGSTIADAVYRNGACYLLCFGDPKNILLRVTADGTVVQHLIPNERLCASRFFLDGQTVKVLFTSAKGLQLQEITMEPFQDGGRLFTEPQKQDSPWEKSAKATITRLLPFDFYRPRLNARGPHGSPAGPEVQIASMNLNCLGWHLAPMALSQAQDFFVCGGDPPFIASRSGKSWVKHELKTLHIRDCVTAVVQGSDAFLSGIRSGSYRTIRVSRSGEVLRQVSGVYCRSL